MATDDIWGADVDALDQLGRDLEAAAERLASVRTRLRARIHASSWGGGDADRFIADWEGVHRAAFDATENALRAAADVVHKNADEQRKASSADSGSLGGAGDLLPGVVKVVAGLSAGAGNVGKGLDILNGIRHKGYNELWTELQKTFPRLTDKGEFFRFRRSPTIQKVEQLVRRPSPVAPVLEQLESHKFIKGLGGAGLVDSAVDVYKAWRSGDGVKVGTEAMDLVGDVVKTSKLSGNPAAYLIGVNLSLYSHVIDEGRKVDWSAQGWKDIGSASLGDWASAFAESGRKLPGLLWDII